MQNPELIKVNQSTMNKAIKIEETFCKNILIEISGYSETVKNYYHRSIIISKKGSVFSLFANNFSFNEHSDFNSGTGILGTEIKKSDEPITTFDEVAKRIIKMIGEVQTICGNVEVDIVSPDSSGYLSFELKIGTKLLPKFACFGNNTTNTSDKILDKILTAVSKLFVENIGNVGKFIGSKVMKL